ncbi:MAG: hypothetical protein K8W52_26405 [Deltaproteobacteria bacterium]|nr:hypothetical protein [Deltaproteobacteria bacterium]
MTTTQRFASLLFLAVAPLSACMDATAANGNDRALDNNPVTEAVATDVDQRAQVTDEGPAVGHLVGAEASCANGVARMVAYTSAPGEEVELRMAAVFRAPATPNGRWIQARESFELAPMVHAPASPTYVWMADIALDADTTCDDWKAQLEEVRARFDRRIEIGNLHDRTAFGFIPKWTNPGPVAHVTDAASMDGEVAPSDDGTTGGTDTGVMYGHEINSIDQGSVAHLPERASADK